MVSLASVNRRFEVPFEVIEKGQGTVYAILSETEQSSQPSYVFVQPRHVLRTAAATALRAGMVVRSPGGDVFIVGDNGPSEQASGTIWQSFRVFAATGRYSWSRRTTVIDPIARQPKEGPMIDLDPIWAALEPLDREQSDREMRINFEQFRLITGADIRNGDLVSNRAVTKLDKQMGLAIGMVT